MSLRFLIPFRNLFLFLSPSELFQACSQSYRIPMKGEKYFLPNDTEQQRVCLQKTFDEHWLLVAEERIERM